MALGCVREVGEGDSEVILPLSAVYSNKMRLVVDASRHLNPYVKKVNTTLEDLKHFPFSSDVNDFCTVDDLDSGYWHIPLSKESWKYCGCTLVNPEDGVRHYYQWTVLFLGLTSAVTIFTEILAPVTSYLRSLGWRGQLYIDDVISCAASKNESHYWRIFSTDVLGRCGWVINPSKGQDPTQCPKFLGFLCDTKSRRFLIPTKKIVAIIDGIKYITKRRSVATKKLASVLGLITSCICALGRSFVRFLIRSCNRDLCEIVELFGWKGYVKLAEDSMRDLRFLCENIGQLNGHEMIEGSEKIVFDLFFAGDASAIGGYLGDIRNNETLVSFPFSEEEMRGSSTLRELLVLYKFYVLGIISDLAGLYIVHYCDNKGVAAIMEKGSGKPHLHHLARQIKIACRNHNIVLTVEWKRRSEPEMVDADAGSRGPWLLCEDYSLDAGTMDFIREEYTFTCDAMASYRSRVVEKYFSIGFELEAFAVDFFAQHLERKEFYWVIKTHSMITRFV